MGHQDAASPPSPNHIAPPPPLPLGIYPLALELHLSLPHLTWLNLTPPTPRKMTLHQLLWKIFDVDPQIDGFIERIQEKLSEPVEQAGTGTSTKRGGRLNTKLRQQLTIQEFSGDSGSSFWERNFQSDDEVPWYKFQKCFLEDYESQLSSMY